VPANSVIPCSRASVKALALTARPPAHPRAHRGPFTGGPPPPHPALAALGPWCGVQLGGGLSGAALIPGWSPLVESEELS
jgi:hypothetical protein